MSKNDGFEIDGGWVGTTIMLALFWPVGLFMLWNKIKQFKKGRNEAKQMRRAGISILAAGIGMAVFGLSGWGIPGAIIGGCLLHASKTTSRREMRYKRYQAIIGGRPFMPIREIAAAIPVPFSQAEQELQNMIELGYFGLTSYIDKKTMCIVLDAGAHSRETWRQEPIYAEPEPEVSQTAEAQQEEFRKEEPRKDQKPEQQDQFSQWITAIREVNDRIEDRVISDKIDRIEELTGKIFEMVKKRPDKEGQIRKFMNYYLPTTLKLLDSYALLEEQGIEGENITASKHQIEGIMDTLIQGFEKQLDMLFSAQAMDINSDIEVLENMMAVDGLKENDFRIKRTAGK